MKKIILLICLVVCCQMLNAQIEVKFNPSGEKLSEIVNYKKSTTVLLPSKILPNFNLDSVLQEDVKRMDKGLPFKYGYKFSVLYSPSNSGKWQVENDLAVWRLRVKSANAYSLSFHFSKYYLPETASLIIYNEEESFLYGPLTSIQNSEKNKFTTGPVQGEDITIELSVPAKLKDKVQLEISRIIHGYVNILPISSTSSASLSCHNNVACYQAWGDESDAVAKLIMGTGLCSGSIQNNTANDYRAFLLTAFHCVDTNHDGNYDGNDYDVDDYVFHFHYKSSTCVGTSASYIEYNGSSYRAGWSDSDFALIEMNDSPVGNGNIAFLGWDNRANTPTSGTFIHHPAGDIMKISFDYDPLTTNNHILNWDYGPSSPVSTHWDADLDNGAFEGGSSGAPLFNQNSRVVGQLHGGYVQCPPTTAYFGRFDVSWTGNGTNATQLAHWLDPNNTGDPTTDLLRSPSITVPDVICYSGTTVSMQNPPSGVTIRWGGTNVAYPYGNTGASVTVRAASSSTSDEGTVTASFTVNSIQRTITHPVWAGTPDHDNISITGDDWVVPINSIFSATTSEEMYIDYYQWDLPYGFTITQGQGTNTIRFNAPSGFGSDYYGLQLHNTCGTIGRNYIMYEAPSKSIITISPNPTTGETTISIEQANSDEKALKSASTEPTFDETAEWDLEVYDNVQNLKLKKDRLKGNSTKIQTAGWKEGVYMVRVKYKDEALPGKLVVKK